MDSITAQFLDAEAAYQEYAGYRVELLEPKRQLCVVLPDGRLQWNFHMGQRKVMESQKRIIAAIAGRQSGKSTAGPIWLHEEMRRRGPGLYMVVAPSYPILQDSAIRWIKQLFETYRKLGKMRLNPPTFEISKDGERRLFAGTQWANKNNLPPTTIRFGHAANPESLEAKTALAAWLDEAGQDGFKLASWEAVEGRLTTTQGRTLITTTPYNLGWLKQRIIDPWEKANEDHPLIDVISWASVENPAFSRDEYERLRETMPMWKWQMFYNGKFDSPAGLIYGLMRDYENELKVKRSDIPLDGPCYGGLDFGGPNTCALLARKDARTGDIFVYRAYYPGESMPIREHVKRIFDGEKYIERFAGGAKSEGSFREEFWQNGLRVEEPDFGNNVQTGIDRVYALIAQKRLHICEDLQGVWDELYSYQYETDPETGNVLAELKIKSKSSYHHMDALRYLCTFFGSMVPQSIARAGGERTDLTVLNKQIARVNGYTGLQQTGAASSGRVARSGSVRRGSDIIQPHQGVSGARRTRRRIITE